MKYPRVVVIALSGIYLLAATPQKKTEEEVRKAEQSLNEALLHGDWRAIESLYADDLIFTNADGSVTHKSDDVEALKSGDVKFDSIEATDVKVQDLGTAAVATGNLVEKASYKGQDLSGSYRYTDVRVKRNGKWRMVTGQETFYKTPR